MTREQEAITYFESKKKELEDFREIYPSPDTVGYQATTKEISFYDIAISALSENKRNTAEWEIDGHHLKCPICGEYFCRLDAEQCAIPCNFCPNCGADMRGEI